MKIVKWALVAILEDGTTQDISPYVDEFVARALNHTCDYWEDEHHEITEDEETL